MDNENDVWVCTQNEFNQLTSLDKDVIYIIVEGKTIKRIYKHDYDCGWELY